MGIFSKPKTPAPFDAAGNLQKQQDANTKNVQTQAQFNRPNQAGEDWNVTWTQNPDGTFTQSSALTGNAAARRDANYGMGQAALGAGLTGLGMIAGGGNTASVPGLSSFLPGGEYTQSGGGVRTSMYDPQGLMRLGAANMRDLGTNQFEAPEWQDAADRATQYMRLTQGEQTDALDNKLRNQGLEPGTEAYTKAMRDQKVAGDLAVGQATAGVQNQLYSQALGARGQNYNEATGMYGLGLNTAGQNFGQLLQQAQFGAGRDDAARNAAQFGVGTAANLSTADLNRQLAASQGLASLGNSQVSQFNNPLNLPGFTNMSVPNLDVLGAYQTQQNDLWKQYEAQQKQQQALLGGLGALGGQALAWGMAPATAGGFGATNFGKMFS